MNASRLLVPAIRADPDGRFDRAWPKIEGSLKRGVAGFIVFGGAASTVRDLVERIRSGASHPLLLGSDLERGAGQQVAGATSLPPAAAIASLEDPGITRHAGYVTATEARALGLDWIFAPVADLDVEPRNPIVGTRSFGADPERVARHVAAWIEGCHEGGALACAKHFPGHGRTTGDSHLERASVAADRDTLDLDLAPFRAASHVGVDSMMTAHVAYPALDATGQVATLSTAILRDLLRDDIGFGGLVISDALGMAGLSGGVGEGPAAVAALAAGCDLLLYPEREEEVLAAVARALADGRLSADRVAASLGRVEAAIARVGGPHRAAVTAEGWEENRRWADGVALRCVAVLRGDPSLRRANELAEVDDDPGGPHPPPSRDTFRRSLGDRVASHGEGVGGRLIAVYADPRASKGRAGLSDEAVRQVATLCERAPDARVVLFGHPRLASQIPAARHLLCAWGGEPIMQKAAARWLLAR